MNITPGIEVLTRVALPDGFVPAAQYPPLWLQAGTEVAVVGVRNKRTIVMGYGGPGYRDARIIAEDGGIGAPDGVILDLAPSPDGMVLALAVMNPSKEQLAVVTRDVISEGAANPVSVFDGEFESVSLGWLDDFTIPVELRARNASPAPVEASSAPSDSAHPAVAGASSGLYMITNSGIVTTGYQKLNCKMSRLSWSPQGVVAVGEGDAEAPAMVLDRAKEQCQPIGFKAPIQVLDWEHDSKSFLFRETSPNPLLGSYRYDLATNAARIVALSSSAVAFVGDEQILALGSRSLTVPEVQQAPQNAVRAQIALSDASGSNIEVQSLGFLTTPAMLASSTMTYMRATDAAAIATFSPTAAGPVRKIVTYSVAPRHAFMIAFGPARGVTAISWSPRGRYLAIADGDEGAAALTVVVPPR
jgi:hypothetical protein